MDYGQITTCAPHSTSERKIVRLIRCLEATGIDRIRLGRMRNNAAKADEWESSFCPLPEGNGNR